MSIKLRNKLRSISYRNQSLQDILKSCNKGDQVMSVSPVSNGIHNTKLILKLKTGEKRVHFYNRLDLKDVLSSGLLLPIENVSETLDILNVEQQGDFEREDLIFNEFDIEAHPDSLGYIGRVATFPWTVKYRVISTGEIVRIDTGPIVTKESIDPDVDFEGSSDQGASISAWREAITDRDDLYISHNATTVKEGAFNSWTGLEKVHTDATELEKSSFMGSSNITEFITLPNTRHILGTLVTGCYFTKLEFREGLQTIYTSAFPGCNFTGGTLVIPDSVSKYFALGWNDDRTEQLQVPVTGLSAIFGVEKLIIGGGVPKIDTQQWSSMLSNVKHLEFRPGVTHIEGSWAVARNSCETLILPQGLLSIGSVSSNYTFGDFNKLKELVIPGTVQYISKYCFQSMEMLERLTIEEGVGIIDDIAFQNFGSKWSNNPHPLKEFNFWGGTVIGEMAFQNWYLADKEFTLTIPKTVEEIRKSAFQNHDVTKGLFFEDGCRAEVGNDAFLNWPVATELYIPDSIKSITGSFNNWYSGSKLYIGNGIKELGGMVDKWGYGNLSLEPEFQNWGFSYCNGSANSANATKLVIIPDSVETIYSAFTGSSWVENLIVSKNLKKCGRLGSASYSYLGSPAQKNMFLRSPVEPVPAEHEVAFFDRASPGQIVHVPDLAGYSGVVGNNFTTYVPPPLITDPHVPSSIVVQPGDWDVQYTDLETGIVHTANGTVRGIIDDGFASKVDLNLVDDIVIGTSVTHIGSSAFSSINSIKRVLFLGNNLKSIGPGAFAGCFVYGGNVLTLPDSLERVGASAFATLALLNKLTYGNNFISVSAGAFGTSNKFTVPSKLLPPSPTFVSNTTTTITGTALAGDTIVGSIKRGEETIELPPTPVGEDGIFTIDLSTLEEPATIQSGDRIGLLVRDIVSNVSAVTSTTLT